MLGYADPGRPDPGGVRAAAGPGPAAPVLEIGAGTGKATVALAARGLPVTCLEPDPRMAAVLRRNTRDFPLVVVREAALEEHAGLDGTFGLVLAAQSWHWLDPERRVDLARRALRNGGALALLWNSTLVPPGGLRDELLAVHAAHGAQEEGSHTLRDPFPPPDDVWETTPQGRELAADRRFGDLRQQTVKVGYEFGTRRYLDYLDSLSRYRILPTARRSALMADVARVADAHGGRFAVTTYELLMLARATG
jgi:SAM-dependent methyltransferase